MSSIVPPIAAVSPAAVVVVLSLGFALLLAFALYAGDRAYWERARRDLLDEPPARAYVGSALSAREQNAVDGWTRQLANSSQELVPLLHNRLTGREQRTAVLWAEKTKGEQVPRWRSGLLVDDSEAQVEDAQRDLAAAYGATLSLDGASDNPLGD